MIKIFRRIRQRLLTENLPDWPVRTVHLGGWAGRYLLYAIGEILLVIIGILIALQINNWNDKRIEKKELNTSLHSMIEELNQNIQFLDAEKEDKQKRLLALAKINDGTGTDQELKQIVFAFSDEIKSKEFSTVYLSLKDEKKIRLIQSQELRNQITTFYEYELASIRDANTWHEKFVSENIDPFILEYIPLSDDYETDLEDVKALFNHSKFKNILKSQKMIYKGYVSMNEKVTKLAHDLKSAISSHLKK